MRKLLATAMLLLAGCAHQSTKETVFYPEPYQLAHVATGASIQEMASYVARVQDSIKTNFVHPEHYHGKTCKLSLTLEQSGLLQSVQSEGGDPALCDAAIEASKKATFPAMSDNVYKVFHVTAMDFKL